MKGASSHSGDSKSINASASRTRPSTAGAAATIAIDRDSPRGDGPRNATTPQHADRAARRSPSRSGRTSDGANSQATRSDDPVGVRPEAQHVDASRCPET